MNKVVKKIIGYKTLTDDMMSGHGCEKWKVGVWKKHKGELMLCNGGFHASRHPLDTLEFVQGNRLFLVEGRGEIIEDKDKFVIREMKLKAEIKDLKKISVEFSIYCAKRCLPNYEKKYPDDKRVRQAIEAAEAWLKAKTPEQKEAARSAASAVESAAWSTASAAESAAWSAAESTAWSAAWSAARSATESATRSAASAARSAAESAAESAAWSVAESAIRKKFMKIIKRELKEAKK